MDIVGRRPGRTEASVEEVRCDSEGAEGREDLGNPSAEVTEGSSEEEYPEPSEEDHQEGQEDLEPWVDWVKRATGIAETQLKSAGFTD